jgi:hypothetical protein
MTSSLFLRRILALDALSCVAMGLLMGLGAASLAPLLGLPLPLAAFIAWLAARPAPPRALVCVVIIGNLGWTAESFAVIGQSQPAITALGTAFVSAQALAVLGLAALEYIGLRRLHIA